MLVVVFGSFFCQPPVKDHLLPENLHISPCYTYLYTVSGARFGRQPSLHPATVAKRYGLFTSKTTRYVCNFHQQVCFSRQ